MSGKKKILFVRPNMGKGGADRVTWQLLHHIDRDRYDTELAVMRATGPFMKNLPEDVKVHELKANNFVQMILPLWRLLRQREYDILYSTSGSTNIAVGLVGGVAGRVSTVVLSERNILPPSYKGKFRRGVLLNLKKFSYRAADWVTTVSKGIARELGKDLGIPDRKLKVVDNPLIDEQLFHLKSQPIRHPFFEEGKQVVLAAGRFVAQKDFSTLIRAFKLLVEQHGDTFSPRLVILGDGPLQERIQQEVVDNGLEDLVSLPGFLENPYKYMAAADIFVLSSIHEGMPGVLVQAMACGTACVSTNCPTGPNEIITDGKDGFLVPVGDAEQMADRLNLLMQDADLRHRMAAAAPLAVARFRTDRALQTYFEFLEG